MPRRVILLGDSIRLGYAPLVAEMLAGEFEVVTPAQNCATTLMTLRHFEAWAVEPATAATGEVLLHVNCGLHDLAYKRLEPSNAPADTPEVEPAAYARNVEAILRRAIDDAGIPPRQILWATTTPVIEARHNTAKPFKRLEADVRAYNDAALRVAQSLGCGVDDLYAVVMEHDPETLLTEDGVHYTAEGNAILAKAVASAIRAVSPGR